MPYLPGARGGSRVGADLRALLSPKQRDAWDLTARTRALLCGRRAGKTVWAAAWLLEAARTSPRSLSVYLALTSKSARFIVWPVLREVCRLAGIDATFNDHALTCTLPNGAQIVVAGTDDVRTIETWRGIKLRRAVIDECGSQPPFLEYVYREILKPATLDLDGELAFCGTPSPLLVGFWYDMTGPHSKMGIPVAHWDVRDNPHIDDVDRKLREVREEHGWSEDSPAYRREYLAEWCEDAGELVYPLDFKPTDERPHGRNGVAPSLDGPSGLPTHNAAGRMLDRSRWRYVIGCDVGVVDATAIAVVACHEDIRDDFVVRTEKHHGWIADNLADRLRELMALYPGAPVVLDTGGMGKEHATVLQTRYAIAIEPAEKREKESHVREWRERIIAGRLLVLTWKHNDAFRDECCRLGWDADRRLPNPQQEDHAVDATIYALRKLRHYRREDELPELEQHSAEATAKRLHDIETARRSRSSRESNARGKLRGLA